MSRIWADAIIPDDNMDVEPGHRYWNPHADKANRASYDYSALLYLNTHCSRGAEDATGTGRCDYENTAQPHFAGGQFAWLDRARDHVIEPRGGRLVHFTGGLENLHHLRKVTAGTRYVIGMWFTCHAELEYRDEDDSRGQETPARGGSGQEHLGRVAESPPPVPSRRRRVAAATSIHDDGADGTGSFVGRDTATDHGLADTDHGLAGAATMAETLAAYEAVLRRYDEAFGSEDSLADAVDAAWKASEPHQANEEAGPWDRGTDGAAGSDTGPGHRRDCGYPGITQAECVHEHGCLWDDTQLGVPWCFRTFTAAPASSSTST